jgi:hypothetical protein
LHCSQEKSRIASWIDVNGTSLVTIYRIFQQPTTMTFTNPIRRRTTNLPTWREQILAHPDNAMRERLLALDDERIAKMAQLKVLRSQEKLNAPPPKRKVPQQPPVTRKRSATIKAWVETQWEHQHEQQRGRDQEAKRKRRWPIPSPEPPRREFLERSLFFMPMISAKNGDKLETK